MAVFAYQGTGDRGERRVGELDAPSRSEALRRLALDRIQPLSLVAKADGPRTAHIVKGETQNARLLRHG